MCAGGGRDRDAPSAATPERTGEAGYADKQGVDPALLLTAFVTFLGRYPALTRVALAARDPLWSHGDRKATAALYGSIRHCIHARGCSDVWVEQILGVLLFVARDMQGTGSVRPPSGWSRAFGESDPYSVRSPIGILLRLLLVSAYRDSDPRP